MYKPHKLILVLAILAVLIPTIAILSQSNLAPVTTSTEEVIKPEKPDYTDDASYPYFYGRLYIESVGIDVALYRDHYYKQRAVDRKDSACYFRMSNGGWIIADHNTQAFKTLLDVEVGMEALIVTKDGEIEPYVCVEVLDGVNTGHGITNKAGRVQHGRYDLLMYTCMNGWKNVRVVHWEKIGQVVEESNDYQ